MVEFTRSALLLDNYPDSDFKDAFSLDGELRY
jgi:hypothetical protein